MRCDHVNTYDCTLNKRQNRNRSLRFVCRKNQQSKLFQRDWRRARHQQEVQERQPSLSTPQSSLPFPFEFPASGKHRFLWFLRTRNGTALGASPRTLRRSNSEFIPPLPALYLLHNIVVGASCLWLLVASQLVWM